MFSGITNIFKPAPLKTEKTDTRQEIKRHEPEYEQRKEGKRKKTAQEIFGEDGATVSVDALQLFLENFLKSQNVKADDAFAAASTNAPRQAPDPETLTGEDSDDDEYTPPELPSPGSGTAAYAAQMYQSMSHKIEEKSRAHILANASLEDGPEIALSPSDVRIIHNLLKDLKKLEVREIHYLHIERQDDFLQSIVDAVAKVI